MRIDDSGSQARLEVPSARAEGPPDHAAPRRLRSVATAEPGDRAASRWADQMLTALSNGLLDQVSAELETADATDPVVRLLAADVHVRRFESTTTELAELREDIAAHDTDGGALSLWAAAVTAEHLLVGLDPMAPVVAATALAAAPTDPLPTLRLAYARARLLRVVSLASLGLPDSAGVSPHQWSHDEAVGLMLRYGLHNEVAVTCALTVAGRAVVTGEDAREGYALLVDARRRFPEGTPSLWPGMVDVGLAMLAIMLRDVPVARAAVARIDTARMPGLPGAFPAQARVLLRLITEGFDPSILEEAWQAADATPDLHHRGLFLRHVAALLIDLDRAEALTVARPALALPPRGAMDRLERDILQARLDALARTPQDADTISTTLDALAEAGRPRNASFFALQLAHDCHRAGATHTAEVLYARGLAGAPDPEDRAFEEAAMARPLGTPRPELGDDGSGVPRGGGATIVQLEMLRPDLVIRRGDESVVVPPTAATLLVALAHAHPNPLHVELVHDILWPERELRPNRLNTLVHRLRASIGGPAEVLRRDGPLLRLDDRYCDVDLWRYRRRLQAGDEERVRALAGVRGNLCDAQLPYNEHLVEARHQVLAEWLRLATAAVGAGVPPAQLADAAAGLHATDELGDALARSR